MRYKGNLVVGYGEFGITNFSTDILLDSNINVNATLPDVVGNRTSNVHVMLYNHTTE